MGHPTKNIVTAEGQILRPCSRCRELKSLEDYCLRNKKEKWYPAACKSCMAKIAKVGYYRDVEKSRKQARGYAKKVRKPKIEFTNQVKASTPCADCRCRFPAICMDFDHLPGTKKTADVSQMANGGGFSMEDLQKEIAKCEIVCANCHRIRTSKRPKHRKK